MLELTLVEKSVLVNDLGCRLETIAEFLHDHTQEVDVEEFFKTLYFPLRGICGNLEATLDLNIQ